MWRLSTTAAIALLLWLGTASPAAAQTCASTWMPDDGLNLSGHLGDGEIRAYLDVGFPADSPNEVSGGFLYPERWTPGEGRLDAEFTLEGSFDESCEIRLTDSAQSVWHLRFGPGNTLQGTRQARGSVEEPVLLSVVPALDCSGEGEWKTFSSPHWPISFAYPASWRLDETGNEIAMECPDAERLALGGGSIWFKRGTYRSSVRTEDGREATVIGDFVRFKGDEWLVGVPCVDRDAIGTTVCSRARRSRWKGVTVLQGAAGEHRQYRVGGGYLGQGPGIMRYLLLLDDRWVSIASEDPPLAIDEALGASESGPVIFDGDGVTERLVRSIEIVTQD